MTISYIVVVSSLRALARIHIAVITKGIPASFVIDFITLLKFVNLELNYNNDYVIKIYIV